MIHEFFTSSLNTILEMFKSGGIITYIITIIGIYGFYSLEKIFYLRKYPKLAWQRLWVKLTKPWKEEVH